MLRVCSSGGLQTDRYDIIATPVWATSERARIIDFSASLYYSPVCACAKAGNKKFSSDLRKADFTFTEPADAAIFMKNNPGAVERVGAPVRVFPNCWIFRRNQVEFKNMLDTALTQLINSGGVERILAKYEPSPNTLYRVSLPYQRRNPM